MLDTGTHLSPAQMTGILNLPDEFIEHRDILRIRLNYGK
jgi:hypothetical protein